MIEEQATVTAVEGDYAWVQTQRSTACDSCSAQKGCGTSTLGKVIGRQYTQVRALNSSGAQVGDEVMVGLAEDMLLKSSLAVYLVPIVLMLMGGVLGDYWSAGNSLYAALASGLGLALGFVWIQWFSHKISHNERFQPVVLRTLVAARPEFKITITP